MCHVEVEMFDLYKFLTGLIFAVPAHHSFKDICHAGGSSIALRLAR